MLQNNFLRLDGVKISYRKNFEGESSSKPIIFFIHGFLGSKNDWAKIMDAVCDRFHGVALDLPGFGESDISSQDFHFAEKFITEVIKQLISNFSAREKFLCGYSMGGRAALSFAVKHCHLIDKLILESTTAGIESPGERIDRISNDEKLCEMISNDGIEIFLKYWDSLPLFSSQKKLKQSLLEEIRAERLKLDPEAMIKSLKNFGTGRMTSHWNSLGEINIPALLITGELDEKFNSINKKMLNFLPKAKHEIVQNAGHNCHLEKPDEFVNLLHTFINI